eukprot:6370417-Prymnesium_polylepis.1
MCAPLALRAGRRADHGACGPVRFRLLRCDWRRLKVRRLRAPRAAADPRAPRAAADPNPRAIWPCTCVRWRAARAARAARAV